MRTSILVVYCLLAFPLPAKGLSLPEAVQMFEQSVQGIQTYDLRLTVNRRWHARTVVVDKKQVGFEEVPVHEWRTLAPGETQPAQTHHWRQVRDQVGRRRIEVLDRRGRNIGTTGVFDGEVTRTLNETTRTGYLGPAMPQFIQSDEDYVGYYANELETPFLQMLRERSGVTLVTDSQHPGAIAFDIPPEDGKSLGSFGFQIRLDAEHGLMPSRIEVRRKNLDGEVVPWRVTEVKRFHQFEPEHWAPVEVVHTTLAPSGPLKGSPTQESVAIVDVAHSRWNTDCDAATFALAFPPGVSIVDDLRRVSFVTGNSNRESNLQALADQAKKVVGNTRTLPEPRDDASGLKLALIVLNVGLIVVLLAALSWRTLRRRQAL